MDDRVRAVQSRFTLGTAHIANNGLSSIWTVTVADGRAHRVTGRGIEVSPVWLPDSRSLLFVSDRDGVRDVYRIRIRRDGRVRGRPERITTGLNAHGIDVSADGRTLAYSTYTAYSHIWSVPISASSPATLADATQITAGNEAIEGFALSPDSRWLAYDSDRSGNGDIWKVPVDGGPAQQLTTGPTGDYVQDFSPDGNSLAFDAWSTRTGMMSNLYLVSRPRPGAPWGAARALEVQGSDASWSPGGGRIAYVRDRALHLLDLATRESRTLVAADGDQGGRGEVQFAYWSADGSTVYFKAFDEEGHASIWAVPAAGGTPRLLLRLDDPARPSLRREFATDGRRLYFTVAAPQADIWVMALQPGDTAAGR